MTDVAQLVETTDGPEDVWWERAVLGAILQGYDADGTSHAVIDFPRLKRLISKVDFSIPLHGYLWDLCVQIDADGEVPTVALIVDRMGGLAQRMPGGPVYLSDLWGSGEILAIQAERYAAKLRECSLIRQAGQVGLRMIQSVREPGTDPYALLANTQAWLDRIREQGESLVDGRPSALEQVINTAERGETGAPTTAWTDIDSLVGGWYPGVLTVVAARPSVGKSLFAENAVTDLVRKHGLHALFISLEMSRYEITQRTLAHTAGVNLSALRAGKHHLNEKDWGRINRAVPKLEADSERLTIADQGGQTILDIKAAIVAAHRRAHRAGSRLALVAVDYLGLIRAMDPRLSRQAYLGDAIVELKALAKQYDTHLLVLAQLNRNPEARSDKRPQMSDIRDTGEVEQTADLVWLLHQEEIDNNGKMVKSDEIEAVLAKQRNGPTGIRTLLKMGEYARLAQPEKQFPTTPSHLSVVKD